MNAALFKALCLTLVLATSTLGQQSWTRPYAGLQDSPFQEWGMEGTFRLEDFEDGEFNIPGATLVSGSTQQGSIFIASADSVLVSSANSIAEDTGDPVTGSFLLGVPTICATSYPLLCPATVNLEFDANQELPTFGGFAWTDAVQSSNPRSGLPFGIVTAYTADGGFEVARMFDLPALDMDNIASDDLFIGFVDYRGIERIEFQVVTDKEGGYLAMDHFQFGRAALLGDANRDGIVDFDDYLTLAEHFGDAGDWSDGDFNFDGVVAFDDFLQMSENFGKTIAVASSVTPVPEPSALALVAICILLGFSLRLRRSHHNIP